MKIDFDSFIDAKGLKCPKPLLMVKTAIMQLQSGEKLKLEATDPHTDLDLEAWCGRFEHKLLQTSSHNEIFTFIIEKK